MKITGKVVVPKEISDFYKALNSIYSKPIGQSDSIALTGEQKALSVDQKVPLLNFVDFMRDKGEVNRIFEEVCQVLLAHRPQLSDEIEKIKTDLDVQVKDFRPLLEQFVWQNELYIEDYLKDRELNGELLSLILFNVAKPLVTVYAKELKDQVLYDEWYQNTCPVCGWKASIAVTSTENKKRVLHCSLCETAWPFKTMACPHCSNEDHTTLKYISVENDEVYKINVCDKCSGYIKTLDESKVAVKNSSMEEDVRTLHLDIIAQREGYLKETSIPSDKEPN